ncbi:MAG: helix-turn-helix transcriptional regulator [Chitinophagaceae bacterium]|nr:helix-turn-helix transcriptional regulator [Chitinophagaceae bacterium]
MQTKIERYIIQKVKERRIKVGLSQLDLSQKLEMNDSFVSHVESPNRRAKYNINHLNAIAKVLECSPRDFWPEKSI